MFRFENPAAFQFLLVIPVLIVVFISMDRTHQRRLAKVFTDRLRPFLMGSVSLNRRKWKRIFQILTLALMVVALARPQMGQSKQKMISEGIELVILFDVSTSMLAEDVRPSRLDMAKREISRLIDTSKGDRIGLIAFAGSAVLISPVTNDKGALKMLVEGLNETTVSNQGTEFAKALDDAGSAFKRGGVEEGENSGVTRAIIIASDGEDNEPGAKKAAEDLVKAGVHIFSLGFGTEKGGMIPLRNERGELRGYHKDRAGREVISQTKGTVLKELAKHGRGSFYHATPDGRAVASIVADIDRLEKSKFGSADNISYDERFQSLLALAILLAFFEFIFAERRSEGRLWRGRFEVLQK